MKIASKSCQNRENHIKIVKICDTRLIMKVTAEIKDMCKPLDLPGGLAAVDGKMSHKVFEEKFAILELRKQNFDANLDVLETNFTKIWL